MLGPPAHRRSRSVDFRSLSFQLDPPPGSDRFLHSRTTGSRGPLRPFEASQRGRLGFHWRSGVPDVARSRRHPRSTRHELSFAGLRGRFQGGGGRPRGRGIIRARSRQW